MEPWEKPRNHYNGVSTETRAPTPRSPRCAAPASAPSCPLSRPDGCLGTPARPASPSAPLPAVPTPDGKAAPDRPSPSRPPVTLAWSRAPFRRCLAQRGSAADYCRSAVPKSATACPLKDVVTDLNKTSPRSGQGHGDVRGTCVPGLRVAWRLLALPSRWFRSRTGGMLAS